MVYLSRIYTRTGDQGGTGLGDGSRVSKDDPRVAAYGTVDELNSVLGLLLARQPAPPETDLLRSIQNDLFDVRRRSMLPAPRKREGRRTAAACRPARSYAWRTPSTD